MLTKMHAAQDQAWHARAAWRYQSVILCFFSGENSLQKLQGNAEVTGRRQSHLDHVRLSNGCARMASESFLIIESRLFLFVFFAAPHSSSPGEAS
jgi:hypothetical protein